MLRNSADSALKKEGVAKVGVAESETPFSRAWIRHCSMQPWPIPTRRVSFTCWLYDDVSIVHTCILCRVAYHLRTCWPAGWIVKCSLHDGGTGWWRLIPAGVLSWIFACFYVVVVLYLLCTCKWNHLMHLKCELHALDTNLMYRGLPIKFKFCASGHTLLAPSRTLGCLWVKGRSSQECISGCPEEEHCHSAVSCAPNWSIHPSSYCFLLRTYKI